jgi:hypothetical protein
MDAAISNNAIMITHSPFDIRPPCGLLRPMDQFFPGGPERDANQALRPI